MKQQPDITEMYIWSSVSVIKNLQKLMNFKNKIVMCTGCLSQSFQKSQCFQIQIIRNLLY